MDHDAKIDESIETARVSRPRWRRIVRRILKYGLLAILLAISILTAVTWARSYKTADRVHGSIGEKNMFLLGSKEGGMFFVAHGPPGWPQWRTVSYPIGDELSFPTGSMKQHVNQLGFGTMKNPFYFVMRPVQELPDGTRVHVMGAATAHYRGWGVIVPHWFVLLVTGSLLTFILLGRRFTLRAFLIWVTIVCVILAIEVRTSSDSKAEKEQGGQHGK